MYTETDLVQIAKRENNPKRNYLVVNKLQGKHIPVKASLAFSMFYDLADQVSDSFKNENILLVGFAETATAIGLAVAHKCRMPYIQTTREEIADVSYLFFSEEHSHATEQKLVKEDMDQICPHVERIVFIEDEVTTGKTILNIVRLLQKNYPFLSKFAVASLLNGMNEDAIGEYGRRGIALCYLVKTNHEAYATLANKFSGNGTYIHCKSQPLLPSDNIVQLEIFSHINARRLTSPWEYDRETERLWNEIEKNICLENYESALVIGTEEFMYPALRIAQKMEKLVRDVTCHSTTRSPIAVSPEKEYPLHCRYELPGLYDKNRKTYLYDIAGKDCVFIVTDAPKTETEGLTSLIAALKTCGNHSFYIVRWCLQ